MGNINNVRIMNRKAEDIMLHIKQLPYKKCLAMYGDGRKQVVEMILAKLENDEQNKAIQRDVLFHYLEEYKEVTSEIESYEWDAETFEQLAEKEKLYYRLIISTYIVKQM